MTKVRYPPNTKLEAIKLIRRGQNIASAARTLEIARTTLSDWVKAEISGTLDVSAADQVEEIQHLREELARVGLERDLLIKIVVRLAAWKG